MTVLRPDHQALADRDGYSCFYCGKTEFAATADHVIPTSKGGSDDLENLVLACHLCNATKNNKQAWLFIIEQWAGITAFQARQFDKYLRKMRPWEFA